MALLQNGTLLNAEPIKNTGGAAAQCVIRPNYGRAEQYLNRYVGQSGISYKSGFPNGYGPPYQIVMPLNDGGMSIYGGICSVGSISANIIMGRNFEATVSSSGSIEETVMSLAYHFLANLVGQGEIDDTSNLIGSVRIQSEIIGHGEIDSSSLGILSGLGVILAGLSSMSSDIQITMGMAANIDGQSEVESILIGLIDIAANILGDSSIQIPISTPANMASSIQASGNLENALLKAIGWFVAEITSQSELTCDLRGKSSMGSTISSAGEVLTAQSCAIAVWSALAEAYSASGSAGEILISARDEAKKVRKFASNRAVISSDRRTVTIYDDDGGTVLHVFDISTNQLERTPQ